MCQSRHYLINRTANQNCYFVLEPETTNIMYSNFHKLDIVRKFRSCVFRFQNIMYILLTICSGFVECPCRSRIILKLELYFSKTLLFHKLFIFPFIFKCWTSNGPHPLQKANNLYLADLMVQ